ncbi:Alpha/Beta hydrolase protein [Pelagophyceae sp. CCMP2097]|nr:Alpha/Beta hydrolase protein [Pelagophyceae sp. CCMP2097]
MLRAIEEVSLALPASLATGPVSATFTRTSAKPARAPPVVLLHGFDSSLLEFRRVMPTLEERGLEAYALDIFGWGFSDTTAATSVGIEAKREHLYAFWATVLEKRPMVLAGVSLGAAVIIDFYAAHPEAVHSVQLIDPQGFIDGAPPVPEAFARGGIRVLGSWPLRWVGNQLSYYDAATYVNDDAVRVGLLHTRRPAWEDDSVQWLLGGGYSVSPLVPKLRGVPTSIVWGRQDEILPPKEYLPKFLEAVPDATFRWIEACGHTPHLEQPAALSDAIVAFARGEALPGDATVAFPAAQSPLDAFNAFLDTPLLDTNKRGGPMEPFKAFAREEPETAQVVASAFALAFFVVLGRGAVGTLALVQAAAI